MESLQPCACTLDDAQHTCQWAAAQTAGQLLSKYLQATAVREIWQHSDLSCSLLTRVQQPAAEAGLLSDPRHSCRHASSAYGQLTLPLYCHRSRGAATLLAGSWQ